jgi:AcrR family transcriptional regulator
MSKRGRMAPEQRREQIIECAREVFIESGFSGTRTRNIAERAGITEAFLYHHFDSKDEIYDAAVREPLERLVQRLVEDTRKLADERSASRSEMFSHFHEILLDCMSQIAPLLAVVLFSDVVHGKAFYAETVAPNFSRAIGSVIIDVTGWDADSVELDLLVEMLFGVHFGVSLWAVLDQIPLDVPRVAQQLALMFGSGIPDDQLKDERPPAPRIPVQSKPTEQAFSVPLTPPPPTTEEGTKKRVSGPERRILILNAAREVFIESGYSAARTDEIAERAGITKGFLFRLFSSKEQLYRESIEEPLVELYRNLETKTIELSQQENLSSVVRLERVIELLLVMVVNGAPMISVALFSDITRGRKFYIEECTVRFRTVQQFVSEAVGWKPPVVDDDVVMHGIFGSVFGTALDYMLRDVPREAHDISDIARRLTTLFTIGIRERP